MNTTWNITNGPEQCAFEVFERGLYIYGVPVICIFGILANILSFKVFVFTSLGNNSSSVYIAALSLSDTGFLMSLFLSWLSAGRIGIRYGHNPVWCHAMIYVTYVCGFLSVWYVVLIMIDRYIVICHSQHVPCTKRRARIATIIVTLFAMFIYCHTFFTTEFMGENCIVQYQPFVLNLLSIFIYIDTFITFIIPFATILFLNVIVIASIKRFQTRNALLKERRGVLKHLNVLSMAQFRITRMLILLSAVLIVTNVPSHGIRFYIIVNQLIYKQESTLTYAQQSFQFLYYFNFAVNFLLYSASSKHFRKFISFQHMFYCLYRRLKKRQDDHLYK